MNAPTFADWALLFLQGLYRAQIALARVLHAIGLTGDADGQAAWPWTHRIALETLRIDAGLTRQLAFAVAATALAVVLAGIALASRKWRVVSAVAALAVAWFAPWPPSSLWLSPAVPTSFQRDPAPFSVSNVMRGAHLYAQHCAACHGADGRGEGPLAATLPRWPPTFAGALLARRLDGELFWRACATARATNGGSTMLRHDARPLGPLGRARPESACRGQRRAGGRRGPCRSRCRRSTCAAAPPRPSRSSAGATAASACASSRSRRAPPPEDARWQTLLVTARGAPVAQATGAARADCVASTPDAWRAFATIAGVAPDALGGTQLLADRRGWLQARALPGSAGWSDADLLCRSDATARPAVPAATGDPLTALLLRVDTEPVRDVQAGLPID